MHVPGFFYMVNIYFLGAIWRAPFKSFSAQPADVILACGVSRHSPASLLGKTSARLRLQKDTTSPAGAEISYRFAPSVSPATDGFIIQVQLVVRKKDFSHSLEVTV